MPAYIVSRTKVKNQDLMKEYAAKSIPLAISHGGKYIVRTNNVEALDGSYDGRRLVIMEFPDVKSVRAFWDSPSIKNYARCALPRRTATSGSFRKTDGNFDRKSVDRFPREIL